MTEHSQALSSARVVDRRRFQPGREAHRGRDRVPRQLAALVEAYGELTDACDRAGRDRGAAEIEETLTVLAESGRRSVDRLQPFLRGDGAEEIAVRAPRPSLPGAAPGAAEVTSRLHDLYLLHAEVETALVVLIQVAVAAGDDSLAETCRRLGEQSRQQRDRLQTHLMSARAGGLQPNGRSRQLSLWDRGTAR